MSAASSNVSVDVDIGMRVGVVVYEHVSRGSPSCRAMRRSRRVATKPRFFAIVR